MNKRSFLLLSLMTLPSFAQSILTTLNQHQNSLQKPQSFVGGQSPSSSSQSQPEVRASTQDTSSQSIECRSEDQTSLPLAYITSLIQEKDGKLEYTHDRSTGKLTISSADMIGNCSSMLEWTLKRPEIKGRPAYAIEVKIKKGDGCSDTGCTYKVAKVEKGDFQNFEQMVFKPTFKGFEECLQKSGVISGGKVNSDAIYNQPVNERFDSLTNTGDLYFLSNGPVSRQVKAKYGKFEFINGCDHYEAAHPGIKRLLTAEDAEKERLDAEAAKLRACKVEDYGKLADFIEKYEGYHAELGQVRDRLILEAVKKSAAAIEAGKFTEDDLKVIGDFERYIVQPKIDLARSLYDEMIELEGDAKKAKQDELVKVLTEISTLRKKPYYGQSHVLKLVNGGRFDEAEKLNAIALTMEHHQNLASRIQGVVITPGVASQRVNLARNQFKGWLEEQKREYMAKTGQSAPESPRYSALANLYKKNIQKVQANYSEEIQYWYARTRPGGYCYAYWRNTQKCIAEAIEEIQYLSEEMKQKQEMFQKLSEENEALAKKWGGLEAQGRRYIAKQNGEEPPVEAPQTTQVDPTAPTRGRQEEDRPQPQGSYSFNWSGGQQAAPQMPQINPFQSPYPFQQNNMFSQPQSPYGFYQQPSMGQQGFMGQMGFQGGYGFNWGGGAPQQQPYGYQQQMPFYNSPFQAYNGYNFYGRR
jgi:hypothetical protein